VRKPIYLALLLVALAPRSGNCNPVEIGVSMGLGTRAYFYNSNANIVSTKSQLFPNIGLQANMNRWILFYNFSVGNHIYTYKTDRATIDNSTWQVQKELSQNISEIGLGYSLIKTDAFELVPRISLERKSYSSFFVYDIRVSQDGEELSRTENNRIPHNELSYLVGGGFSGSYNLWGNKLKLRLDIIASKNLEGDNLFAFAQEVKGQTNFNLNLVYFLNRKASLAE